jgi:hypothetical protein
LPSSSTSRTALALNSSVNCRHGRRFGDSIGLDIVSPTRKMSTESDHAHAIGTLAKRASVCVSVQL